MPPVITALSMLRRPESGGFLLGLVGGIALATFAYIVVVLLADPSKATTVAEGVEDATETPSQEQQNEDDRPSTPSQADVTEASQAIIDRYKELKYPALGDLSADFSEQILTAYREGSLFDIERMESDAGTISLVGTTDYGYCGGYGQPLCFIFAQRNDELKIVYIVDAFIGSPRFSMASVELESFGDDDDEFILVRPFGDAGHWEETGYLVNVATNNVTEIAKLLVQEGEPAVITSGEAELTLEVEDVTQEVAGDVVYYTKRITVSDGEKTFDPIEGYYDPNTEDLIGISYLVTATEPDDNILVHVLGKHYLYKSESHELILGEM